MPNTHRHTKIVFTVGPASTPPETLHALATSGADGCRINMAHANPADVRTTVTLARYVSGHRALLQLSQALGTWVALGSGFTAPFNFTLLASGIQANRYQLILPLLAFAALNVRLTALPE